MLCRSLSLEIGQLVYTLNIKIIMSCKCGENADWCKPCLINDLKTNLTSGNEKIDDEDDIVFEWISYNQFSDIEEIGRGGFATVYSAIWKDGQIKYDKNNEEYTRKSKQKVALKCLH